MGEAWHAQVSTAGRWVWCLRVLNGWWGEWVVGENEWVVGEHSLLIGAEGSQVWLVG